MAYVDNEAEIPKYRDSVYFNPVKMKSIRESGTGSRIVHKVRRGETLGLLARRYHTTVSKIKKWNHLRGTTIRIGQRLYIYR
jgi:membrane-bound lytic murein transglycosylase D